MLQVEAGAGPVEEEQWRGEGVEQGGTADSVAVFNDMLHAATVGGSAHK